jgi:hypothetical protein
VVSEAVEGASLRQVLGRHEALPPRAALLVLSRSLLGLAAVHQRGLVLRDLRPSHVRVTRAGIALTDVGIVALVESGAPIRRAPELWLGQPFAAAADVYAATCVFVECVAGHPAYPDAAPSTLMGRHTTAPVPTDGVPEPLWPLLHAGLAKDPARRPGAAAFAELVRTTAEAAYGPGWEQSAAAELTAAAVPLVEPFDPASSTPWAVHARPATPSSHTTQGRHTTPAGAAAAAYPARRAGPVRLGRMDWPPRRAGPAVGIALAVVVALALGWMVGWVARGEPQIDRPPVVAQGEAGPTTTGPTTTITTTTTTTMTTTPPTTPTTPDEPAVTTAIDPPREAAGWKFRFVVTEVSRGPSAADPTRRAITVRGTAEHRERDLVKTEVRVLDQTDAALDPGPGGHFDEHPPFDQPERFALVLWDGDPPATTLTLTFRNWYWPGDQNLVIRDVPVP